MAEEIQKTSISVAAHYIWGAQCDGWRLVQSAGLSVIEERMPPGAEEQRHMHRKARQFFFVLEGELILEVANQSIVLRAREGLEVGPGVPHQAMNKSAVDVRFLVISQPPSQGDRVVAQVL